MREAHEVEDALPLDVPEIFWSNSQNTPSSLSFTEGAAVVKHRARPKALSLDLELRIALLHSDIFIFCLSLSDANFNVLVHV